MEGRRVDELFEVIWLLEAVVVAVGCPLNFGICGTVGITAGTKFCLCSLYFPTCRPNVEHL